MSKLAIGRRLLFLLVCLWMVLPIGGCSGAKQPPAAPAAAAKPQGGTDLDIKPILRDFLANLPADWNLAPAQDVVKAKPFIVDVRPPEDYAKGFIAGAVNIPLRNWPQSLQALPAMDQDIVVACNSGHRAAIGMAVLQMLGYKKARSLEGGMEAWRQAKLPVGHRARSAATCRSGAERRQAAAGRAQLLPGSARCPLRGCGFSGDSDRGPEAQVLGGARGSAGNLRPGTLAAPGCGHAGRVCETRLSKSRQHPSARAGGPGLDNVPLPEVSGGPVEFPMRIIRRRR